ncbi:hypothetical protein J2754_001592 [Halarchaeum solikamskense]|uniref:hypothetical protein n=1 Tax=Halarchaeum nitratireducens TaxID=489913 RepID=UPI001B3AAF58|nr:hypothetical protein [Halarchaeum solikamskense]MBP2251271.1 hypothetical protein [Halarchaeum solikamskense]
MTVYLDNRKAEILGANLDRGMLTVRYHPDEYHDGSTAVEHKDPLDDHHRGDEHTVPVHQLRADGGTAEVAQTILALPDTAVSGRAEWVEEYRVADDE